MNLDISFDELRNHINECIDYISPPRKPTASAVG